MKTITTLFATAGLVATVSAHGMLTSPAPRTPGASMIAACGQQAGNQDQYGNVQGLLSTAQNQPDYHADQCKAWQCKGNTYADNTAKLQHLTVGQVLAMTFDVRAPHTGVANVSIVNTATNTIIGQPLKSYSSFASNQVGVQPDELSFSVTIPDVSSECATPGACVIQHYWNAADINQTYESCVDFVIGGGSSSGSSSAPASSAATSAAATTSSAAATTAAPAPTTLTTSVRPASGTTTAAAGTTTSSAAASATGGQQPLPSGTDLKTLVAWIGAVLDDYYGESA
ncbi:hypothetical protein K461DRAFT_275712 [Myriangium duriaei CBS 260.36]|uniref:Chitin-binding type-4 domain-containing protein n=1 Tax=Myriangium duriaei CBS 260.36 TaxID=1168546 RepID=A0A9P4MIS0_9PEZI|nr:hypothetical protein K461DRAFT_275712 [Myriangium duriaei CBS 260.36]